MQRKAFINRMEDILYFCESDRIWPPTIQANSNHPFLKALVVVLKRIPVVAFDRVVDCVWFVFEDSRFTGMNVPLKASYPPSKKGIKIEYYTIIIFARSLLFRHTALVGLIAHEIAHTFVNGSDYG